MSDDYLWDGSGEPDPVLQKLEQQLGEARFRPPFVPRAAARPARRRARLVIAGALAAAACAACALWLLRPRGPSLLVTRVSGKPTVATRPIGGSARFYPGAWLETDADSGAEIALAELGRVSVGPRSRVRLRATGPAEQRLELERGRLHARVTAPPRLFVVETPAAAAVDLGCEYTLTVGDDRVSRLEVERGEVELSGAGRVSRVPAGFRCETRPNTAPGIPYADDAPEAFKRSLGAWESGGGAPALADTLARARQGDAVSLWHLAERTAGADQKSVVARLSALVPAPPDGNREAWWARCTGD